MILYVYVLVTICDCTYMSADGTRGGWKRPLGSLELELQTAVYVQTSI